MNALRHGRSLHFPRRPNGLAEYWAAAPRAVIGLLLIAGYLLAVLGYPTGGPVAMKDQSEPFPCMTSACGCRTAAQCRTSCCCHSKQDKIDWALARGIDPNRVAILTAEESARYGLELAGRKKSNCCVTLAAGCESKGGCCSDSTQGSAQKETKSTWVIGLKALACGSSGGHWIQTGFVALVPEMPELMVEEDSAAAPVHAAQLYSPPSLEGPDRPG